MLPVKRFAGYGVGGEWSEVRDGPTVALAAPPSWVQVEPRAIDRIKSALRFLFGAVAKLLWLSPLLWLVSVIVGGELAKILLVAFVALAVVFFALLNVYVLVSVVAWQQRKQRSLEVRPPHRHWPELPAALPAPEDRRAPPAAGSVVQLTGDLVALSAQAPPHLVMDLWSADDPPLRLTEASPFAVVHAGRMPLVVNPTRPPSLLGRAETQRLSAFTPTLSPNLNVLYSRVPVIADQSPVDRLTLRPGDRVKITGVVAAVVDDATRFELDGVPASVTLPQEAGGSPYREQERRPAVLLQAESVIVERLGG